MITLSVEKPVFLVIQELLNNWVLNQSVSQTKSLYNWITLFGKIKNMFCNNMSLLLILYNFKDKYQTFSEISSIQTSNIIKTYINTNIYFQQVYMVLASPNLQNLSARSICNNKMYICYFLHFLLCWFIQQKITLNLISMGTCLLYCFYSSCANLKFSRFLTIKVVKASIKNNLLQYY